MPGEVACPDCDGRMHWAKVSLNAHIHAQCAERRHQGRKNSPNLVRVISREWQAWMRRGRRFTQRRPGELDLSQGIGCKTLHPTDTRVLKHAAAAPKTTVAKLPTRQGRFDEGDLREFARVADPAKAMR